MVSIIWSDLALKDLKSIYKFIAQDSLTYAERYVNTLINRIEIFYSNPFAGKVVLEFQRADLREILEGHYRIIIGL